MREINEPFDPDNECQFIRNSGMRIDKLFEDIRFNIKWFKDKNKDFEVRYRLRYCNADEEDIGSTVSYVYRDTAGDVFNGGKVEADIVIKDLERQFELVCNMFLYYGYRPDSLIEVVIENCIGDRWVYKYYFDSATSWYYYKYKGGDISYKALPKGVGTFLLSGNSKFPEDFKK